MADSFDGAEVDEFELFRARAYGVESELRQQRTSSVRSPSGVKVGAGRRHHQPPAAPQQQQQQQTTPPAATSQSRTAAERKASFKSSSRRRHVIDQQIPEESEAVSGRDLQPEAETAPDVDTGDDGEETAAKTRRATAAERQRLARNVNGNGNTNRSGRNRMCEDDEVAELRRRRADLDNESGQQQQRRRRRNVARGLPVDRGSSFGGFHLASGQQQLEPGDDESAEACRVYRMRSFYTKSGNIVNRGDSVRVHHGPKYRGGAPGDVVGAQRGAGGTPGAPGDAGEFRGGSAKSAGARNSPRHTAAASDTDSVTSGRVHSPTTCGSERRRRIDPDADGSPSSQRHKNASGNSSSSGRQPLNGTADAGSDDVISGAPGGNGAARPRDQLTVDRPVSGAVRRMRSSSANESTEEGAASTYRVLVIGSQGVGKTTLTQQLLTSEYLANMESFTEDETGEKLVSVQLDDEESWLQFIDVPGSEVSKSRDSQVDAHLVVYSVTDKGSFSFAQTCLQDLRPAKRHNVVILVGNKQDLVRNRIISEEEGKHLATKRHCKFIEVSALLNHRMEELLVGTLRQIRLRQTRSTGNPPPSTNAAASTTAAGGGGGGRRSAGAADGGARGAGRQNGGPDSTSSPPELALGCLHRAAVVLFRKLFQRPIARSTSCDDLFKP